MEPLETVARRADGFWDNWWAPVLAKTEEGEKNQQNGDKEGELIVAVSHGAYIPSLWERMVARWEVEGTNGEDVVGRWRNTAFCVLRFEKKKDGGGWKVVVERNMGTPHLEGTGAVTKQPIAGEEGANL